MVETICYVFYRSSVDTNRKAIMVFDYNLEKSDIINEIAKYLEEEEMDDDEYSPLQTKEDCKEAAENIVNGGLLDLDMDCYFIDEDVTFFKKV